ncbi:hypothetical protein D3C73_885570 [compost metagenome]
MRDIQVQRLTGLFAQGGGQFQERAATVADVVHDQHGLIRNIVRHARFSDAAGLRVAHLFGVAYVRHAQRLGQGLHALAGAGIRGHQRDALGKGGRRQRVLQECRGVHHAQALQQRGRHVAVRLDHGHGGVLLIVDQLAEHGGAQGFTGVADAVLARVRHVGHVQVHRHRRVQAAQGVGQHQQLHDVVSRLEQGMDAERAGGIGLGPQVGRHRNLAFAAGKYKRGRRAGEALSFYYRSDGEHDQPLVAFQN